VALPRRPAIPVQASQGPPRPADGTIPTNEPKKGTRVTRSSRRQRINAGRHVRSTAWIVGALGLASLVRPAPVAGQGRVGGQGVYQSVLLGGTFGLGVRGQLDLGFAFDGLSLLGSYDRYFPSDCGGDCAFWEGSASLVVAGGPSVYFGAGTAFQRFDRPDDQATTEDWLVNLILGLNLPGSAYVTPFAEARFQAFSETTNQIVFSVGALLGPRRARPRGFGGR